MRVCGRARVRNEPLVINKTDKHTHTQRSTGRDGGAIEMRAERGDAGSACLRVPALLGLMFSSFMANG